MANPSLRIDWFDGSVIHNQPANSAVITEDTENPTGSNTKPYMEKKPIGFKRLLDISLMEPDKLTLEVSYRPGFWNLLDQPELKGDFIVLIVNALDSIFKTIKNDKANSRMVKHLQTRFLTSDFLEKVTEYVINLPLVKTVEKRMNSQLWDDIQTFFFKLISLCEGIIHFCSRTNKEVTIRVDKLLRAIIMSMLGVSQNHLEKFDDVLFENIAKIEKEIHVEKISIVVPTLPKNTSTTISFKSLNIFPTHLDFFNPVITDNIDKVSILKLLNITPSIDRGAYSSVEHYLDVQFRLLREDYLGPLREGICNYKKNPSKTVHENLRVHKEVRIVGTQVKNNSIGHLIDLAWRERRLSGKVKQKVYNKHLMSGSLLLFTCDKFHTILCATVLDSNAALLKNGFLLVSFQNPVSKNIFSNIYLMVESEVFFEPYHRVLKVLQGSRLDKMPMQKYIVEVKPEISLPTYLGMNTFYTIKDAYNSEIPFKVINTNQWPTKHLNLDESQLEAFQFALTREFAVIQGPPGTGKTFLGTKIASTILENHSLKDTPMLVICYTNNALDQFLEGILRTTNKIVRLGSQSKSTKLEPYSLWNVKSKINYKHHGFSKSKRELQLIYDEMTAIQTQIELTENTILSYKSVKPYFTIDGKQYALKDSRDSTILDWLFEHLEDSNSSKYEEIDEDSWENYDETDSADEGKILNCFSEEITQKQMAIIEDSIKQLADLNFDEKLNPEKIKLFEKELEKTRKRLLWFKNQMQLNKDRNKEYKIEPVNDVYSLSTEKRWQLYFNAANKVRDKLLSDLDLMLIQHKAVSLELEELSTQADCEVIRQAGARVVGMTTTAAARRHQLVNKLNSNIVIIEEAAEVLEAHIIASLTFSLQHLILIGDHKQLRPTAANYLLAKECNLEVSLFERMVANGIHTRTLTTQRRMRPEFVQLLVPEIYPKLDCHDSVLTYPDVKGMTKNLFFLKHEVFEDSDGEDSFVYENGHEAEWCVALARYFVAVGYAPEDVTILATYNGQVARITKLSDKVEELTDVKVTTVDNFQGEESRIVILSLVRSNKDGRIGFLSATNRICVALSRAKEGFYIVGNMAMLSKASSLWTSINKKLIAQDAIGDELCTVTPVQTAVELIELCSQQTTVSRDVARENNSRDVARENNDKCDLQ